MTIGNDPSYSGQSKVYIKQQPAGTTLNGNTVVTEEVTDVGGVQNLLGLSAVNNLVVASKVGFAIAPGAATHCVITITIQDNGGQAITGQPFDLDVMLSDSASGVGLTATTPSGGVAVSTGTLLNTYVASKAFYIQSGSLATIVINITDAAKTGFYVMVQGCSLPYAYVSRQLLTADYG